MKPRPFAIALARVASDALKGFFGERLFSRRAFVRAATIGTALMMSTLVLTSFMGIKYLPMKAAQHCSSMNVKTYWADFHNPNAAIIKSEKVSMN